MLIKVLKIIFIIALLIIFFNSMQVLRNISDLKKYNNYIDSFTVRKDQSISLNDKRERNISNLIQKNSETSVTYNNEAELIFKEEEVFNKIFKEIVKAENHIHIQFYIIRNDKLGQKLKDYLIKKATEGIKVRIIYDALGSHALKRNYKEELKQAGIEVEAYNNLIESILKGKLNHRNHRKLLIIDGNIGFIGDMNIGNEYVDGIKRKSVMLEIKGQAVREMQKIFLNDWYYIKNENIVGKNYFPRNRGTGDLAIQIVSGGPDTYWNEIEQTYFAMITAAKESIWITTPYLILSESLLNALQVASLKGIEVKVIISKKTDFFLLDWANASYFKELLEAGVNIYLYPNAFLHTKLLTVDNKMLSIGSANFNSRGFYLDYETNAVIFDQVIIKSLIEELNVYLEKSEKINLSDYSSVTKRIKGIIGRLITPIT